MVIYQDSIEEIYEDKRTWQKSNPSLGVVKLESYLEDMMNKSKNDHSIKVTMLCKTLISNKPTKVLG